MRASLEGTVALVTGASSGIGAATAIALATQGAKVALVARRKERLDDVETQIREQNGRAFAIKADVADERDIRTVIDAVVLELGRLDTLVNCAGVMHVASVVDGPVAEWEQMVKTNALGLFYCTRAALPHLMRAAQMDPRRVADIVNSGSTNGRFPRRDRAVYSASKAAVHGFSEALRQELSGSHVRVSLVQPGAVDTELHRSDPAEPTVRLSPVDIADAVAYVVTRRRAVSVSEIMVRP